MKVLSSLKGEFYNIIKTKKLLVAIIGIMFIPLIYSGAYLWAFWDPYGHVDKLPVAVVNNDKGTSYNGKSLTVGADLVDKLKKEKKFDWHFVEPKQAERGLQNQDYYIEIEIPEDFSKNAATLQSSEPKSLELLYTPNEGANYLTSKIGDSAIGQIKEEVANAVTKTYAEAMFNNIKDVSKGLEEASKGAGELHNGIESAENGAGRIDKGISSAKKGANYLRNGIDTALKGSTQLNSGIKTVKSGTESVTANLRTIAEKSIVFSEGIQSANAGANVLASGLQGLNGGLGQMKAAQAKLLDGAQKVKAGTDAIGTGANNLASQTGHWKESAEQTRSGSETVSSGLSQITAQVESMSQQSSNPAEKAKLEQLKGKLQELTEGSRKVDTGLSGLADGADAINIGANKLSNGADQAAAGQNSMVQGLTAYGAKLEEAQTGGLKLETGSRNLSAGLAKLAEGSKQLEEATNRLAAGSNQLSDGLGNLSGGSEGLVNGMSKLSGGSMSLLTGIDQLNGGTGDLVNGMRKLSSGAGELQNKLQDGSKDAGNVKANDQVYDMFASPVQVKETHLNRVPNYGTGFAPYFLPLSLFVGSLVVSIIFPLRRPAVMPHSGLGWFSGKLGVLLTIGMVQAVLADLVLIGLLGLEVKSIPLFILLSIFTSWTFLAIVQFLVTALDNPGRFIAILVLVAQLVSSAGTYPIELVPEILQGVAKFLPMTYAVAAFRTIISTGDFDFMWHNTAILAVFFSAAILCSLAFFMISFNRGHGLEEQKA
ncbi:putative membrane protein [Peribacillus deserti]|uniref:Membrane protein n=1 Tax=Peribacillus deserti TaxID=673318 RepID=A0ABS2QJN8_9BACI|nr:YhgE/Pip domain-containing protein [Peribacillus deserti]MBM7692944.1 putative membrane protein [Peribacillus deserti]